MRRSVCGAGVASQVAALRELLSAERRRYGRFTCADVYVSDGHARIALVPWQHNLHSPGQVNAYGRAILESKGLTNSAEWGTHTGFRHHGAPGLASSLPLNLVEQLNVELGEVGVALRSVLSVSAAIYWYHSPALKKGNSVLMIHEQGRVTAAIYEAGKLCAFDVEPIVGAVEQAAARIEMRIQLRFPSIELVEVCGQPLAAWYESRQSQAFDQTRVSKVPFLDWSFA